MIKAIEHFSFTVSNLENSLHFFCGQLGLQAGPIMEVDHPDVQQIVGMADAKLRISVVKLPGNQAIELIEYTRPRGKALDLATCNTGVAHIAFEVDDIDRLYKNLSDQGIHFVNPPVWAPANSGEGLWGVCYLKGPDDITFEMIEKK